MIALGNPGSGKSTLLNSLAGEFLFESGISIGKGLTKELGKKKNNIATFLDTPGLDDPKIRNNAAKAITTGLKQNGNYKILFLFTEKNGRILEKDVTTLKSVLNTVPEIGKKYGIIVNKVSKRTLTELSKNSQEFIDIMFSGIKEESRCPVNRIMFLGMIKDLKGKTNIVAPCDMLKNDAGMTLHHFVHEEVPAVNIKEENVCDMVVEDCDKEN